VISVKSDAKLYYTTLISRYECKVGRGECRSQNKGRFWLSQLKENDTSTNRRVPLLSNVTEGEGTSRRQVVELAVNRYVLAGWPHKSRAWKSLSVLMREKIGTVE